MFLYMVELELVDPRDEAEWVIWHEQHVKKLASVPGISSAQRFQKIGGETPAYLAIYRLDGPDVLNSDQYRASGGPSSASMWTTRLRNWRRNVLEGLTDLPMIEQGEHVHLVDRLDASAPPLPQGYLAFRPISLDHSIKERGVVAGNQVDVPPVEANRTASRYFRAISRAHGKPVRIVS